MLVAMGDHVLTPPPAGCPGAAPSSYWSAGSSPAPWVPCLLLPHLCAGTLLSAELNQSHIPQL